MTPLAPSEIRAWRRPGAILLVWALRLFGAWLVAGPIAAVIGSRLAHGARADAALFEPGSALLLDVVRTEQASLLGLVPQVALALLTVATLGLVPLAALLVALAHGGRLRIAEWAGRTAACLPVLYLLAGVTVLAQLALLAAAALGLSVARGALATSLGDRGGDLGLLALALVAVASVLAIGVLHDLARAAVVRLELGAADAVRAAARAALRRPWRILADYAGLAAWGAALVVGAAAVVGRLHVEYGSSWRLGAVFATHQLCVLGLVALRAAWLGRALCAVAAPTPTREP